MMCITMHEVLCCCVASVVSDSVRPHRRQPTRLPHPWDSPGKNTGVGSHFLLQCVKVKSEREVAQLCPTLRDPMDCSLPGSAIQFSRQEDWSGVPSPSPWKQPKCPSIDEWIKTLWYIYIIEYYSAINKNEIMPFAATWMDLESIILSEISQTEKDKYPMISFICRVHHEKLWAGWSTSWNQDCWEKYQ